MPELPSQGSLLHSTISFLSLVRAEATTTFHSSLDLSVCEIMRWSLSLTYVSLGTVWMKSGCMTHM